MKYFPKLLAVIVVSLIFSLITSAQQIDLSENWLGEIEGQTYPYLNHELKKYTVENVINAKQLLNKIRSTPTQNEWAGEYARWGEMSDSKFIWNPEIGFIDYYIHTCSPELKTLRYGEVSENEISVTRVYKDSNSLKPSKNSLSPLLIKVKKGEKHFLVAENDLLVFSELAVGLNLASLEWEQQGMYRWKTGEQDKSSEGPLILPTKYAKFLRKPISTNISKVGRRQENLVKYDDGTTGISSVDYYLTIDVGKNKNVKRGMRFYINGLEEWADVIRVMPKTSFLLLQRETDNLNKEICRDDRYEEHPCKQPEKGMTGQTQNRTL